MYEGVSEVIFHLKVAKMLRKRILIIKTLRLGVSAVLNKIIPFDTTSVKWVNSPGLNSHLKKNE